MVLVIVTSIAERLKMTNETISLIPGLSIINQRQGFFLFDDIKFYYFFATKLDTIYFSIWICLRNILIIFYIAKTLQIQRKGAQKDNLTN